MIQIKDIYFAGYLVNEGYSVDSFEQSGRILLFNFKIDSDLHLRLKLQFLKSKFNLVKKQVTELKELGS
jgi:hypothetical protein